MKRAFTILIAAVFLLSLSACGKKNSLTGWAYIQNKGTLTIGLDDTFAPMGFRDTNGNLVGFDIDLANAVGDVLGVKISFKPINWDSKELELSSKNIDCIWNGMSATPERQAAMALSDKYLQDRIVIMTLNSNVKIESSADLKNYKIGTQADSAALELIQANADYNSFKSNVTEYDTYDEAILDMQAGRIDCIVVDEVLGIYKNDQMGDKMTTCDFNFGDDYFAIGCRKGETDLADKLNEAIQTLIDNGKAAEISDKWFGKNIVILEGYSS